MKKIEQNNPRITQISIPSSHSSQQVLNTPHWGGGGYQKYQVPKMSRLDQLLSRNQEIYQNMRNQLMEISRSNRNIDANINSIKPMYQSQQVDNYHDQQYADQNYEQQYQEQNHQINENEHNLTNSLSTYKEPYTFEEKSNSNEDNTHSSNITKTNEKYSNQSNSKASGNYREQNKFSINRGPTTNSSQSLSSYSLGAQNNKLIYSLGDSLGSTYNGRAVPIHQNQRQFDNVNFEQADSSPIQSQKFASKQISNMYYASKNLAHIDAPPYKLRKKSQQNNINQIPKNILQNSKLLKNQSQNKQFRQEQKKIKKNSLSNKQILPTNHTIQINQKKKISENQQNNKFQTFQENIYNRSQVIKNNSSGVLIYKKNYVEELSNKQKNKNLSTTTRQDLKIKIPSSSRLRQNTITSVNHPFPPKFSVLYIPFNRLYSSPILQQSNKRQLTLARKSRTHTTTNNLVNRIICGKKYKNINMINEQVNLYQNILKYIGQVEEILRVQRKNMEEKNYDMEQQLFGKDSVDIGIVGGQNSLKKKIHYALIAHIYTDLLKLIKNYYQLQEQKNQQTFQQLSQEKTQRKISKIMIGIQHQEQQSMNDPYVVRYEGQISQQIIENQIVYGNIRAVIQAIFQCMKMKLPQSTQFTQNSNNIPHRIRVTRLYLKIPKQKPKPIGQNLTIQENQIQYITLHNTKIISTNKINLDLISKLQLDAIIWCVNPLYKYFDQTQNVLDCYTAFKSQQKSK